ncbi:MAG: hypothetical protein CVU79_07795 [Elusimicrobia bacterium HGW-Elusimicrobia-3]|nr:MAG: hypothetical protein CVU79_07795 [Elusimicrobia bacterium HGW-Elusimicrobia-3]
MESIVFFGKGGIGKSTISANVSAVLASLGRRVLHVGCDPKMDSTLSLMGRSIPPFSSVSGGASGPHLKSMIFKPPIAGVSCVEAGGPEPGVGCAGVAIGTLLDAVRAENFAERDVYDAFVYDVLGDVVCGGFAAPLKRGVAEKAVIVTSEELLSLYAANNLLKMLNNYSRNGVFLAGLALNVRDREGLKTAQRFARAANVKILGVTFRDKAVTRAEKLRKPAVLAFPGSEFSKNLKRLCLAISAARKPAAPPRPLSDAEFAAFAGDAPAAPAAARAARAGAAPLSVTTLSAAGFTLTGLRDGRLICAWRCSRGELTVEIEPADRAGEGSFRYSDWAARAAPGGNGPERPEEYAPELRKSLAALSAAAYKDLLALFVGGKDPYAAIYALCGRPCKKPHSVPYPDNHLGRWHRFAFPILRDSGYCLPPAALLDYADAECRFNDATKGGGLGLYDLPRNRDLLTPRLPASGIAYVNTDFRLADAVRGDDANLKRCLRKAAAAQTADGLIELHIGCSPLMIGSDLEQAVKDVSAATGTEISLEDVHGFDAEDEERDAKRLAVMVRTLRRAAGKPAYDACLVDFGPGAGALSDYLGRHGVTTRAQHANFTPEAARARLRVLADASSIKAAAFTAAGKKWIAPPLPYGFAAADAWRRSVGASLGKELPGATAEEKKAAAALLRELKPVYAGFILEEADLKRLAAADSDFPAALALPLLAWAGVGVHLLVKTAGRKPQLPPALLRLLKPCRPKVDTFTDQAGLYRALSRAAATRLVYSDIRADARLTAVGKSPFSCALLEYGYAGAVETLRRLAELAKAEY